ncbi:MAG: DUF7352 domain-containing protein [Candidatus Thorarchaeota archaeon]|jgi:hypothetical protein
MSKRIWKFPVTGYKTKLSIPIGSKLLTARLQGPPYNETKCIMLWFEVDPEEDQIVTRTFVSAQTGETCPRGTYIATCEGDDGIIWHVYEDVYGGRGWVQ